MAVGLRRHAGPSTSFHIVRVVVVIAALALFISQLQRSYVGTTVRVTLTWQCANGPSWFQGSRTWWPGFDPDVHQPLETVPATPVGGQYVPLANHQADGHLHFVTRDRAIFTSDAGGSFTLYRLPKNAFLSAGCSLGEFGQRATPRP